MGLEDLSLPALDRAIHGQPIDWSPFAADLESVGSPNRRLIANAAKALELHRRRDFDGVRAVLAAVLAYLRALPLWCGEVRSPSYFFMHRQPLLVLWVLARSLAMHAEEAELAKILRAMLAHLALSAIPGQARTFADSEYTYEGPVRPLVATGPRRPPGAFAPLAGCRGWSKAKDDSTGVRTYWSHLDDTERGTTLEYWSNVRPLSPTTAKVPLLQWSALRERFGIDVLDSLGAAESQALRSFLSSTTDPERAKPLCSWLSARPSRAENLWVRGASGAMATAILRTGHSSTAPMQLAAGYPDGRVVCAAGFSGARATEVHPEMVGPGHVIYTRPARFVLIQDNGRTKPVTVDLSTDFASLAYTVHEFESGDVQIEYADGHVWSALGGQPAPLPGPSPQPPPSPYPEALKVTARPMGDGGWLVVSSRADALLTEIWPEPAAGEMKRWTIGVP